MKDCFFIFDNFFEKNVVDSLNTFLVDFGDHKKWPFIKKENVDKDLDIINQVLYLTWFEKLSFLNDKDIRGFEVWSNCVTKSALHLHVDCDEEHYYKHNEVIPPKYTSVLYTGPKNALVGGELAINLNGIKYFTDNLNADIQQYPEKIKKDTKNWLTIPYKYNRLIVFDANCPHCVLNIQSGTENAPRTALTMALWDHEVSIQTNNE